MSAAHGRFDVLIIGGQVYDGTGGPPVVADIGIAGDRIVAVGALRESGATAATVIDATGIAVAPGFVDVHSHDDAAVLVDPIIPSKLLQGVTTDVVGNCGMGIAPHAVAVHGFATWTPGLEDVPAWEGYGGYLDRLDAEPATVNVAVLVGHGSVRGAVMGNDDRPPSATELDEMRALVREGMDAGAVGMSTGLIYVPGRFAGTDEIIALAGEIPAGGIYTSHMRNEADRLLDAVAETIRIGEEAGVPVQISHHKASGKANWGRVRDSLALVEAARDRGVTVTLDQYPYTAGSTSLGAVIDNGALDGGGGGIGIVDPSDVTIASAVGHPEWEGRNLVAIGEMLGVTPRQAAAVVSDATGGAALVVLELMSEDDVRTVMAHTLVMVGTDGAPTPGKPHPRLWGTFPRILGRYVRDEGVLSLAEAIRCMTSLPAATFGLTDRGVIREGAFADIVVFDPQRIIDTATYDDPCRVPLGITAVLVNGTVAARDGEPTGARPGRALRRPAVLA